MTLANEVEAKAAEQPISQSHGRQKKLVVIQLTTKRIAQHPFPCLRPLTLEEPSNTEKDKGKKIASFGLWITSCAERKKCICYCSSSVR